MLNLPCGIWLLEKLGLRLAYDTRGRSVSFRWLVFLLTFLSYAAFHASRKPITVVKNVLNQNCTSLVPPPGTNTSNPHWCDWEPFAGDDSNTLLGLVDSAFLFSYAFFMFFSGYVAERMDLRYFLALGMILSGLCTWALGAAYVWNIHSLGYFLAIQAIGGLFQASGWPGVVTAMGNWNGKSKRGVIFGIWNSHTCVGNILGSLMASAYVDTDWGMSFIVPSMFVAGIGLADFLFLTPYPSEVGCRPPSPPEAPLLLPPGCESDSDSAPRPALAESDSGASSGPGSGSGSGSETGGYGSCERLQGSASVSGARADRRGERSPLLGGRRTAQDVETGGASGGDPAKRAATPAGPRSRDKAVSFVEAIMIPGVLPFAVCLFFAKMVSYTFLYWLPRYLHSAANYSPSESANLSTLFDVGGIVGGILAGMFNDWTGAPGIVCVGLLVIAIPMMFIYQAVATLSHTLNTLLLVVVGLLVNGPYSLITTAVSADLGTSPSLCCNSRALATVTAIIDGTGSIGAALGPVLAGYASAGDDWTYVFVILMVSDAVAIVSLFWVVRHEFLAIRERRRRRRQADLTSSVTSP